VCCGDYRLHIIKRLLYNTTRKYIRRRHHHQQQPATWKNNGETNKKIKEQKEKESNAQAGKEIRD
jgi:hypothetical protein